MTLIPTHCPVCEAEYQVSNVAIATASRMRCAQCGLMFTPKASARADPPGPETATLAPLMATGGAPEIAAVQRESIDRPPAPLGSPPPYRPLEQAPKRAPPPVVMVPRPPMPASNMRVISAFGPPPPYRPIVQAAAAFSRGPAPDLEPWRPTTIMREPEPERGAPPNLGSTASGETRDGWSLMREPDALLGMAGPGYDGDHALPAGIGFHATQDVPDTDYLVWRASQVAGGIAAFRARGRRRRIWAASILTVILAPWIVLYAGREIVMQTFPKTFFVYAALGIDGSPYSAAARENLTALRSARCADQRRAGMTGPDDGLDPACEGDEPDR